MEPWLERDIGQDELFKKDEFESLSVCFWDYSSRKGESDTLERGSCERAESVRPDKYSGLFFRDVVMGGSIRWFLRHK